MRINHDGFFSKVSGIKYVDGKVTYVDYVGFLSLNDVESLSLT